MNRRTVAIGVVLWLTVVAVGSAVTWAFINEVGRGVTYGARPRLDGAGRLPAAPSSVIPSSRPAQRPTARPRITKSKPTNPKPTNPRPTPVRPPTPARSPTVQLPSAADPTANEVTPPARAPRPQRPPKPRPAPDTQSPPKGEQKVERTWVGSGGRVTASCRGEQVALESASPSNGWRVEVDERGPDRVEVTFEQQDSEESEVRVRVRCVGAQPRFRIDDD